MGFLLLAAVSCGGLALTLGLNEISLADLQNRGPAWTPPEVTPTPVQSTVAASAADAESTTGGLFSRGALVQNATPSRVNIRSSVGYLGKPRSDILAQALPGESMEILDGPTEADSLIWWFVRYRSSDGVEVEGWVAEATASGVTILAVR